MDAGDPELQERNSQRAEILLTETPEPSPAGREEAQENSCSHLLYPFVQNSPFRDDPDHMTLLSLRLSSLIPSSLVSFPPLADESFLGLGEVGPPASPLLSFSLSF